MTWHYTAPPIFLAVYLVLNQCSQSFTGSLQTAVRTRCSSMHFIVAEWNKPSIEFYKRRGASDLSLEEGWRLFKIDKQNLLKMTNEEWTRWQEETCSVVFSLWLTLWWTDRHMSFWSIQGVMLLSKPLTLTHNSI